MLKTRRFKALDGAKGKGTCIVEKIAIYDENGKPIDYRVIKTDEEGREYYNFPNPYSKSVTFSNRPKDAIQCVRDGYADAIKVTDILGMKLTHAVRYLDREYGEGLRQKTIEGWKNAEFAYAVSFLGSGLFDCVSFVSKYDDRLERSVAQEVALIFETEAEAETFIAEVEAETKRYAEEYAALQRDHDPEVDYEAVFKPFLRNVRGKGSIYWRLFKNFVYKDSEDSEEYRCKLKVAQVVVA